MSRFDLVVIVGDFAGLEKTTILEFNLQIPTKNISSKSRA
jgi:hypothetical protein